VVVGDIPVSEADRKMMAALHAPKTGFDSPGHVLGHLDINYDTQLAMAISASLNEGQCYTSVASDKIFDILILLLNHEIVGGKPSNLRFI